jgi:exodeoxyribonuclease VII small subunit
MSGNDDTTPDISDSGGPTVVIIPEDIAAMGFEQARDELTAIVATMESGSVPLEEALALWERGEALAAHCQRWLDAATPPDDDESELDDEDVD